MSRYATDPDPYLGKHEDGCYTCPDCGDVHVCAGRCELPGCSNPVEFEAWFGEGHIVRFRCCRSCVKNSRGYKERGEAALSEAT